MSKVNWLLVGGGAFVGGVSRYAVSLWLATKPFPLATLVVNLAGSLLLGILAAFFAKDHPARLLLGVGVLGGFTTFSSFSLDLLQQIQKGEVSSALVNGLVQVVGGLLLCFVGFWLGSRIQNGG